MKNNELSLGKALEMAIPEVPMVFANSMEQTLASIVQAADQEEVKRQLKQAIGMDRNRKKHNQAKDYSETNRGMAFRRFHLRRVLVATLVVVLLLASVALAVAFRHSVFDMLLGTTPKSGAAMIQHNLAKKTIGNIEIEVKEAAYDGMSLYLLYSIRDTNSTELLGEFDEVSGMRLLAENAMNAMNEANVGPWVDRFWIDGKPIGMPNMSSGITVGSETPGELLFYNLYRLDQDGIFLRDTVMIGLPILNRVDLSSLPRDANGRSILPVDDAHVLSFSLDTSIKNGIQEESPNVETSFDGMTFKASKVTYSPIKLYITLDMDVSSEAIAAMGEGIQDDQGNIIMAYTGADVASQWVYSANLVTKDGQRVFKHAEGFANGYQGADAKSVYFQFPYAEVYPDVMYLAPMEGDTADMTKAVRVR